MEGVILYDGEGKYGMTEIEVRIIHKNGNDWSHKKVERVELTDRFLVLKRSIGNVYAKVEEISSFYFSE